MFPVPLPDPTGSGSGSGSGSENIYPDLPPYSGPFILESNVGVHIQFYDDGGLVCGLVDSVGEFSVTPSTGNFRILLTESGTDEIVLGQIITTNVSQYTNYPPPARTPADMRPPKGYTYQGPKVNYNFTVKSTKDGSVISGSLVSFYFNKSTGAPDAQALSDSSGIVQGFKYSGSSTLKPNYVTIEVSAPGFRTSRVTLNTTGGPDAYAFGLNTIWLQN